MSVHVISWVLRESPAQLLNRLVLIVLADHASHDGEGSYPHPKTIAREARCSVRSAYYALRALEAAGAIEATGHRDGRTVWRVLTTPEAARAKFAHRPTAQTTARSRANDDTAARKPRLARVKAVPEPSREPTPPTPHAQARGGSHHQLELGPPLALVDTQGRARDREKTARQNAEVLAAYLHDHPAAPVTDEISALTARLEQANATSVLFLQGLHLHEATQAGLVLGLALDDSRMFSMSERRYGTVLARELGLPVRLLDCGCHAAAEQRAS